MHQRIVAVSDNNCVWVHFGENNSYHRSITEFALKTVIREKRVTEVKRNSPVLATL